MTDVDNADYAARLQALLAGAAPVPGGANTDSMTAEQLNAFRAKNEAKKLDHELKTSKASGVETAETNRHRQAMDILNAGATAEANQHRQAMDILNAGATAKVNQHRQQMDILKANATAETNQHRQAMDILNATQRKQDYHLKGRVHDENRQLKIQHEQNDYDIRLREQQRKDRELDARLAREQIDDDRELQQSLQHTQIHTRMQHSKQLSAQQAARLITSVGCFTCEGTESLVNELLIKRMTSNPSLIMPSDWRDCVSESITSHGEMVVGDLARRYGRLRNATLDDYVMTDNNMVHTTFARAIAAQIRHTAVSSGLSYKSKYALEATQQTMNRAIRFFERVTHRGGTNFAVVHDEVDTGLPARSIAKFRRGGVSWASSAPESFWA